MKLIDETIGFAKENANSATSPDADAWGAHHRNCIKIKQVHDEEIASLMEVIFQLSEALKHAKRR